MLITPKTPQPQVPDWFILATFVANSHSVEEIVEWTAPLLQHKAAQHEVDFAANYNTVLMDYAERFVAAKASLPKAGPDTPSSHRLWPVFLQTPTPTHSTPEGRMLRTRALEFAEGLSHHRNKALEGATALAISLELLRYGYYARLHEQRAGRGNTPFAKIPASLKPAAKLEEEALEVVGRLADYNARLAQEGRKAPCLDEALINLYIHDRIDLIAATGNPASALLEASSIAYDASGPYTAITRSRAACQGLAHAAQLNGAANPKELKRLADHAQSLLGSVEPSTRRWQTAHLLHHQLPAVQQALAAAHPQGPSVG